MTLTELITRVEQCSGSDRQLDADICVALQWSWDNEFNPRSFRHTKPPSEFVIADDETGCGGVCYPAPLTLSIDAIMALFKARLDGRGLHMFMADDKIPTVTIWDSGLMDDCSSEESETSEHPDIHRAFLSATLKAIAAVWRKSLFTYRREPK